MKKVVLITGGTKGLGKSLVKLFLKKGFQVVTFSRKSKDISKLKKEFKKYGENLVVTKGDVGKSAQIKSIVKRAVKKYGKIDVLINNAGIVKLNLLHKTSEKDWDLIMNVNLKGPYLLCKEVLPIMIKNKGGTIINVSSGLGKKGAPRFSAYCASKFGVIGLTESLSKEVKDKGIKVYSVCPGSVKTPMYFSLVQYRSSRKLKRPLLEPDYVAKKISKLLTKSNKIKSGHSLKVYK